MYLFDCSGGQAFFHAQAIIVLHGQCVATQLTDAPDRKCGIQAPTFYTWSSPRSVSAWPADREGGGLSGEHGIAADK